MKIVYESSYFVAASGAADHFYGTLWIGRILDSNMDEDNSVLSLYVQ